MPTYFCDRLREVSVVNGVARLEFERLEAAGAGDGREVRAVPELTLAIPLQGIVHAMGVLDALRERLLRDGVLQRTPAAADDAPPNPPPDRSPNF